MRQLSANIFDDTYTLVEFAGVVLLETFGEERQTAIAQNPRHVWSVMQAESSDDLMVVAGLRAVNVIGYAVTEEPWQTEGEEHLWFAASGQD